MNTVTIKKYALKICPYFACVLAGSILYCIGNFFGDKLQGLISNIAAAFFSIPLLFLIYDLAQRFSHKQLNKEIFDYAKMLIDREVLSIVNHVSKLVYPYEKYNSTFKGIQDFLSLSLGEFKSQIASFEYLGFQVLKNWSVSEANLHNILKNPFILHSLNDEQVISVINILKSIRWLESVQKQRNLFQISDSLDERYKIQNGREINERNIEYPDRCLLLKDIGEDKYVVTDFGDFATYQKQKLLNICKLNPALINIYSDAIFSIVDSINDWLNVTGGEFLLDTKMFRVQKVPNLKT